MFKLKFIVVKMANDATFNATSHKNYELLCDHEMMIEVTSILPMLEVLIPYTTPFENVSQFALYFIRF